MFQAPFQVLGDMAVKVAVPALSQPYFRLGDRHWVTEMWKQAL